MTVKQLSDYHKISEATVHRYRRKGIDIQNPDAVAAAILSQARRPRGWESGCPWKDNPAPDNDTATGGETLPPDERSLRAQALDAKDYTEARYLWTKLRALKEAKALEIMERQHVPVEEVKADCIRIAHGMKQAMFQISNDLPAVLEGLPASKMQGVIRKKTRKLLLQLSDETSRLYRMDAK